MCIRDRYKIAFWYLINIYYSDIDQRENVLKYVLTLEEVFAMDKVLISVFYTYGPVSYTHLDVYKRQTNGALIVDGGVGIGKNLNVGGTLGVKGTNTGFLARIDNADAGTGDGLEIKLGKTHPAWNGSDYLHLTSPGAEFFDDAIATINGWIDGSEDFDPLDLLNFIPSAYIAGTACNLVNLLTERCV